MLYVYGPQDAVKDVNVGGVQYLAKRGWEKYNKHKQMDWDGSLSMRYYIWRL